MTKFFWFWIKFLKDLGAILRIQSWKLVQKAWSKRFFNSSKMNRMVFGHSNRRKFWNLPCSHKSWIYICVRNNGFTWSLTIISFEDILELTYDDFPTYSKVWNDQFPGPIENILNSDWSEAAKRKVEFWYWKCLFLCSKLKTNVLCWTDFSVPCKSTPWILMFLVKSELVGILYSL